MTETVEGAVATVVTIAVGIEPLTRVLAELRVDGNGHIGIANWCRSRPRARRVTSWQEDNVLAITNGVTSDGDCRQVGRLDLCRREEEVWG